MDGNTSEQWTNESIHTHQTLSKIEFSMSYCRTRSWLIVRLVHDVENGDDDIVDGDVVVEKSFVDLQWLRKVINRT
jgi:hypothetical protein